jgi:hypothetical protein
MNTDMHGKKINVFEITISTVSGNPERHSSGRGAELYLSANCHGDRDEFWIVETKSGMETRRWNTKAVSYIEWFPPAGGSERG